MKKEELNLQLFADGEVEGPTDPALEAIEELKAKLAAAEKKAAESDKRSSILLDRYLNGGTGEENIPEESEPKEDKVTDKEINELRQSLFNNSGSMSNLEYAEKVLRLRKGVIERGENDPFCGFGKNYIPSPDEESIARRVAEGMQHCVDVAEGNTEVFNREWVRILGDTPVIRKK